MEQQEKRQRGGTFGNKGGSGASPKPKKEKKTKQVRMTEKLWKKIRAAARDEGAEWRKFLDTLVESYNEKRKKRRMGK